MRGALAGRVAIGLPPSVAKVLAVPLIREFRAAHAGGHAVDQRRPVGRACRNRWPPAGWTSRCSTTPRPSPELEVTPLLEEAAVPGAAARRASSDDRRRPRPVPLREVADLPLVIPSRPNAIRMLVETEMADLGCRPSVALEIDGVAAILDLVDDGAGSADPVAQRGAATRRGPRPSRCGRSARRRCAASCRMAISSQRPATLTQKAMLELIRQTAHKLLGVRSGPPLG